MKTFWTSHPALRIGLFVLFGSAIAVHPHPLYFLFLGALFVQAPRLLLISALAYAWAAWHAPPTLSAPLTGQGIFHIENLSITASPFNRSYCYKGTLVDFHGEDGTSYSNLPCLLFHPLKQAPSADRDYQIEGTLLQKKKHSLFFKLKKKHPWTPVEKSFSLAQWRFKAKRTVAAYVKRHVPHPTSSAFLSALITGEIDEKAISLDFSRLGLQHLLAISGFHFSFFALVCSLLLRPFVPFKTRSLLLITALGGYFFFLGNAPSILRAFTALSLFFSAGPLKRRASPLNLLGVALIVELLIDPLVLTRLSFQLSFLCTLALLLYAPLMHRLCCFLIKERTPLELRTMPLLDKHGYLLGTLLRKALSANLAVHLFSLPVLLYLFHKFPLLSLLYNLFFPFCVFLSLLLFCLSLLCPPLHLLNSTWIAWLLQLTSHPPVYCNLVLRCHIPFSAVLLILALFFYIGARFWNKNKILN